MEVSLFLFTFTGQNVNNGATFMKAYMEQEKIGADVLREFRCGWNLLPDHLKESAEEMLRTNASASFVDSNLLYQ